ncbi:MAG: WecB/TagA/CpsF family glycosyltransferase [Patescibacteria group bacterium]
MKKFEPISYFHQTLFELPFFATTKQDAVLFIQKSIGDGDFLAIATPNPEQIVQASQDPEFKTALTKFDLFLPDGQGIVWASKILRRPLSERIAGVDVVEELVKEMEQKKQTGLIVGGRGYQESISAGQPLKEKCVEITVGDTKLTWFRDFNRDEVADSQDVLTCVQKNKPTFVFVALGAPYQEEWVSQHREALQKAGVKCVMVVGGAFDVLTGKVQRAPDLIQHIGFEWGWRLLQQPWRWRRQLRLIEFVKLVLQQVDK